MSAVQFYATGRRKTATARVYLRPGGGNLVVNRRPIDAYFHTDALKRVGREPLALTETADKFDILVNVAGGGEAGHGRGIRHGFGRALVPFESAQRGRLQGAGFSTLDH